ncbi:hypothetical protein [Rhodococcus opacus]|uniref:hypothetical protein n=1 Tax=Rhodococcus opacus TaxID=37919 RepID=UPI00294A297E|nr:hypothetical protein [Rhodococcus opacus]MDV6244839.1 hypothetical protein [Rhodococcus opacus]
MWVKICYYILRVPQATVDLAIMLNTPEALSRNLQQLGVPGLVTGKREGHLVRYRMNTAAVRKFGSDFIDTLLH